MNITFSSNYPGFPQLSAKLVYYVDGKEFPSEEEAYKFQQQEINKKLSEIFNAYKQQHAIKDTGIYIVFPNTAIGTYDHVDGFAIVDGMLVASLKVTPHHWSGIHISKTSAFWDNYIEWAGHIDEIFKCLSKVRSSLHTSFKGSNGCHRWGWNPEGQHLAIYRKDDLLKCNVVLQKQ